MFKENQIVVSNKNGFAEILSVNSTGAEKIFTCKDRTDLKETSKSEHIHNTYDTIASDLRVPNMAELIGYYTHLKKTDKKTKGANGFNLELYEPEIDNVDFTFYVPVQKNNRFKELLVKMKVQYFDNLITCLVRYSGCDSVDTISKSDLELALESYKKTISEIKELAVFNNVPIPHVI
jgi:hypothetical protein